MIAIDSISFNVRWKKLTKNICRFHVWTVFMFFFYMRPLTYFSFSEWLYGTSDFLFFRIYIYIWTVQLHVYWRLIVILAYIHTYINIFYLKHKKWSHHSFFFVFLYFLFDMYRCVYKEMKIGVSKDDLFALKVHSFEVFTMATFMYLLKVKKVYLSILFRHAEKMCEAFLFISLILLIVETFFFSFFLCLFIHKAYSTET